MFRRITLAVLATALFAVAPAARAENTPSCDFTREVAAIDEAQKEGRDSVAAVRKELELRKELLRGVIACGRLDLSSLRERLAETESPKGVEGVREQLMNRLDDAAAYYDAAMEKIDGLGLKSSQDLAREIREWRRQTYTPLAEQTLNAIVWLENQELFTIARNRFTDIEQTVSRLKLLEGEEIARKFAAARALSESADRANAAARAALERTPSLDEDTLSPIKASLETLSATYKSFFELSEAVKAILPR